MTIAIHSYTHHHVMYLFVSLLFSDHTYVQSHSIQSSTGSHDYTSSRLKIQYLNGIKLTRFGNPPKTKYMTLLAKKSFVKNISMQK